METNDMSTLHESAHAPQENLAPHQPAADLRSAIAMACASSTAVHDAAVRRERARRALPPGIYSRRDPTYRALDRDYRIALDVYRQHVAVARKTFAVSRGWIVAKHCFSLRQLLTATHGRSWYDYRGECWHPEIDHPEFYRLPTRPWRPAAILSHSYAPPAQLLSFAVENGLAVEFLDASWYYPGATTAVVFTAALAGTPAGRDAHA